MAKLEYRHGFDCECVQCLALDEFFEREMYMEGDPAVHPDEGAFTEDDAL